MEGWRGPAVVLAKLGEGMLTVRFQSTRFDVATNQCRPHLVRTPIASLQNSGPPAPAISDDNQPKPLAALVLDTESGAMFVTETDDEEFGLLVSVTALMPLNTQRLHAVVMYQGVLRPNKAAVQDNLELFNLGLKAAKRRQIENYIGVALVSGQRYVRINGDAAALHVYWWLGDPTKSVLHSATITSMSFDFVSLGVESSNIALLRAVVFAESSPREGPPLTEILKLPIPELPDVPNRVRVYDEESPPMELKPDIYQQKEIEPVEHDHESLATTVPNDMHNQADNQSQITDEAWPYLDADMIEASEECDLPEAEFVKAAYPVTFNNTPSVGDVDAAYHDLYYPILDTHNEMWALPLDKDCRPLTADELVQHKDEIRAAMKKELQSWIDHKAGCPALRNDYTSRTQLKGLPSRWVIEWKRKEGKRIIKARLVIKGFAEQNQHQLECNSPTATRLGHRLILQTSASKKWSLTSLDVSTAFLQGFSFDQLPEKVKRQPCAFVPPPDVFDILSEIDPVWRDAAKEPGKFVFELQKSVYGLKDAPLMWFIAIDAYLKEQGLRPCKHDQCCYVKSKGSQLILFISLHVDDTLCTGLEDELSWLHTALEKRFGKVKIEVGRFRHFGIDIYKCPKLHHVYADQRDYITQLKPIVPEKTRGDGRLQTDFANANEITAFRSLVSAVAWVGVTYPPAAAAASLYQGMLPTPTLGQIHMLNCFVEQLRAEYHPIVFRADLGEDLVLVIIADSSLGNASKYSQGGHIILLCKRNDKYLAGPCTLISFKSGKSKRVASSTCHAETLALVAGVEEGSLVQTFLFEIMHPHLSTLEIINADPLQMIPMKGVTDCHDVLDTVCKPTMPTLQNKSQVLFTSYLREQYSDQRIRSWHWIDTRENPANCLTKLEVSGIMDVAPMTRLLLNGAYEPVLPYRHGLQITDPMHLDLVPFAPPPPPTKEMVEKIPAVSLMVGK